MTQSEIDKSDNKLIALFMGGQPNSDKSYWYFPIPQNEYNHIENFKYDTSWDWLMPVVEKISKTKLTGGKYTECVDFQISLNDGVGWIFWIEGSSGDLNQPQYYAVNGSLLQRTYEAALSFIKWYNNSHNNGK